MRVVCGGWGEGWNEVWLSQWYEKRNVSDLERDLLISGGVPQSGDKRSGDWASICHE